MRKNMDEFVIHFWERVSIRGPDECWPWKRATSKGYGSVYIPLCLYHRKNKITSASYVAFVLTHGPFNSRWLVIRHTCDNPICCNPSHLIIGTRLQNSQDMVKRGRHVKCAGEKHGMAKLTQSKIVNLRVRFQQGTSYRQLGREYNVTHNAIRNAILGLSYKT